MCRLPAGRARRPRGAADRAGKLPGGP